MMTGISTNKKNGAIYRYYKCNAAKRHECDLSMAPKEKIENAVITRIVTLLDDEELLQKLAQRLIKLAKEENADLPPLERRLTDVRRQIDNLVNAIAEGLGSRSAKAKLEALEKEEDELKAKIEKEKQKDGELTEELILFYFQTFKKLDLSIEQNRERLVDALVGKILFNPDGKVTVFLNFSNNPITFDLDDSEQIGDIDSSLFLDPDGSPENKAGERISASLPYFLIIRRRIEPRVFAQSAPRFARKLRALRESERTIKKQASAKCGVQIPGAYRPVLAPSIPPAQTSA